MGVGAIPMASTVRDQSSSPPGRFLALPAARLVDPLGGDQILGREVVQVSSRFVIFALDWIAIPPKGDVDQARAGHRPPGPVLKHDLVLIKAAVVGDVFHGPHVGIGLERGNVFLNSHKSSAQSQLRGETREGRFGDCPAEL